MLQWPTLPAPSSRRSVPSGAGSRGRHRDHGKGGHRDMTTRHIAGSRTSAPRDEAAAVAAPVEAIPAEATSAITAVSETAEPEYAEPEEEAAPEEQPGVAGSAAGKAGVAWPEPGEEE